jgi:hypothetical protein
MTVDLPAITGERLLGTWRETLPGLLQPGDGCEVHLDEADANRKSLVIHIDVAGHEMYSLDFRAEYVDDREIKVELHDVQRGSQHIDERQEEVQELIKDYVRRIRQCAQQLHSLTHN